MIGIVGGGGIVSVRTISSLYQRKSWTILWSDEDSNGKTICGANLGTRLGRENKSNASCEGRCGCLWEQQILGLVLKDRSKKAIWQLCSVIKTSKKTVKRCAISIKNLHYLALCVDFRHLFQACHEGVACRWSWALPKGMNCGRSLFAAIPSAIFHHCHSHVATDYMSWQSFNAQTWGTPSTTSVTNLMVGIRISCSPGCLRSRSGASLSYS